MRWEYVYPAKDVSTNTNLMYDTYDLSFQSNGRYQNPFSKANTNRLKNAIVDFKLIFTLHLMELEIADAE